MLNDFRDFRDIEHRPQTVAPSLLLWVLFLVSLTLAARLVWGLATSGSTTSQAGASSTPRAPVARSPQVAGTPTFAQAAASMRSGRHAEAYGRFVSLAEDGDVDAAQMALLMQRFGPRVFGSQWDATPEQIHDWTLSSQKAEAGDLDALRTAASGRPSP